MTQAAPSSSPSPSFTPNAPLSSSALQAGGQKFKLLAELGRGGMATVFLAVVRGPAGFNKLVVVKCLRPSLAAESDFLEMFLAEARLAARINHPNVVQTNEVGFEEGFYYIAMEYIEGPTLEAAVRKAGAQFPVALHIYAILQTLNGLHHAHELTDFDGKPLHVVHRDVSPHNIMVSYDGHVKLLDFGIAKAADSSGNTRTGILKGKCAYMSAEQFGGHNVDRRADIFAAGVCLWQAITGTRLWKGLSDAEIFSRLSRGEIPNPRTVVPDLPDELVNITMRSLAPRPEDRFATAAQFAGALEDFVNRHPKFRGTQRDLAQFVSQTFASERAKVKATADEQLRQVATSGQSLIQFQNDMASGAALAMSGPALVKRRSLAPVWAAIGLLGLCAVGGSIYAVKARGKTGSTTASGDANAVGATQTKMTITAQPAEAKIFFDDAPLNGNPASATLSRDGLSHRVRAEAPGYGRKNEIVVLDSSNVTVAIELEKEIADDEVDPFGNKLIALTSKSTPPTAHLYLDNILLPSNPTTNKYPRDGKQHQLRAEAPGFITKTQNVTFDVARSTATITMDRDPKWVPPPVPKTAKGTPAHTEPAAPAGAPVAKPAAAPGPAQPATAKTAGGKPLDRDDPWK